MTHMLQNIEFLSMVPDKQWVLPEPHLDLPYEYLDQFDLLETFEAEQLLDPEQIEEGFAAAVHHVVHPDEDAIDWSLQCRNFINQILSVANINSLEILIERIEAHAKGRHLELVYDAYNQRTVHLQMREHVNMLKREQYEKSKRAFVVVERFPLIMRKGAAKIVVFDAARKAQYERVGYRA